MENKHLSCAITGKTVGELPFGMDEQSYGCITLKLLLAEKNSSLITLGVEKFYCNCEYGVPFWAAEIIIGMRGFNKAGINLVIPYEE